MDLKRCEAIVVTGRRPDGGRAGLAPPRRCRNPALAHSEYCEAHACQADLQNVLRGCFRVGWEYGVERWEREQQAAIRRSAR